MRLFLALLVLALVSASTWSQTPRRYVALTFDDLPKALDSGKVKETQKTTTDILSTLKRHRAPAIGFVNERQLYAYGETDARIAILNQWPASGMILGNHTYSHPDLQTTPLSQYEDEVTRGEIVTRRLMRAAGSYQLYFRHPFTHTGPTREVKAAFEEFLRSRGYKIAPFTIENSDYIYNKLYVAAKQTNDQALMTRIRAAYLDNNDAAFAFMEALSKETFNREITQVLLIHANDLNADSLDELLNRLESHGYSFVTLDRALEDKAYQTRDDYVGATGPSWLHRWRVGLGLKSKLVDEPDPPNWILESYKKAITAQQ